MRIESLLKIHDLIESESDLMDTFSEILSDLSGLHEIIEKNRKNEQLSNIIEVL